MADFTLVIVFLAVCGTAWSQDESDMFKKLSGPASEFRNFSEKINVSSLASHSNELRLPPCILSVGIDWKYRFPVDPAVSIFVNVAYMKQSMGDNELVMTLLGPSGSPVEPDMRNTSQSLFGYFSEAAVVSQMFAKPTPGMWTVVLTIKGRASGEPLKALTWIGFNTTGMIMISYSSIQNNVLYKETTVSSFVTADVSDGLGQDLSLYPRLVASVKNCTMTVTMPNGKKMIKAMHPSKDNMVGSFMPVVGGVYSVEVLMAGEEDGYSFARTDTFDISIAALSLNISTNQSHHLKLHHHPVSLSEIILIRVAVLWDNSANPVYRAYAEVYGTDSTGQRIAVAFVSGMVEVKKSSEGYYVEFQLDSKWLIKTKATFPLFLKNIDFEDTSGYETIVHVEEELSLQIKDPRILVWRPSYKPEEIEITYEMRNGFNPYRHKYLNTSYVGTVLLVHGYCASGDPFPDGDFTNSQVFRQFGTGVSIANFAASVMDFVSWNNIGPFSIVAHSQGGMVAVHILEYFNSPMDVLVGRGNRLIQSVGTPYQGTNLARYADEGKFIGIGCGTVADLTPAGAQYWLGGISSGVRSNVFYYTTQYDSGFWNPGSCDWTAEVFLDRPNDGTAELSRSHLPGATHVDHTYGECHTYDMNWPAQTTNGYRNQEMNSLAAR